MPLFLMRPTTDNYEITHERKLWSNEIPMRKNLGPTKSHDKILWTHEISTETRWHDSTRPTRPTMARDPRDLAHSERRIKLLEKNIDRIVNLDHHVSQPFKNYMSSNQSVG